MEITKRFSFRLLLYSKFCYSTVLIGAHVKVLKIESLVSIAESCYHTRMLKFVRLMLGIWQRLRKNGLFIMEFQQCSNVSRIFLAECRHQSAYKAKSRLFTGLLICSPTDIPDSNSKWCTMVEL